MKSCSKCRIEKEESAFHKNSSAKDGLNCYCKACNNLCAKRYKEENPEKVKKAQIRYREENIALRLWRSVKYRSDKDGIPFNLELTDIVLPEKCPLVGITIDYSAGTGRKRTCPSIDRIDPKKGYIKGNIRVVSDLGNRMKSDASIEELKTFAKNIMEEYG